MQAREPIAAVATAPGRGGVGIIRLSGAGVLILAEHIAHKSLLPRHAHYCAFHNSDGEVLDRGLALYFPGPGSFTGEDVVEFHAHGGPVILDLLLRECCRRGARPARPGEFSERAYLNGKLDLAQAEAIADLINSTTEQAALNASRSLHGEFSRRIEALVRAVTELRVYVEAAIDFPEEEIDFLADGLVLARLDNLIEQLDSVALAARQGCLVSEGMKLVIAGKPNAGKSSLLNALTGEDRAIVTPIAGTTRDVLREQIQIDGLPLHIVDTAGLRDSGDAIEQEGVRRAWHEMDSADRILLVIDAQREPGGVQHPDQLWPERQAHLSRSIPVTVVRNKCDLTGAEPALIEQPDYTEISLSAKTGAGLSLLRQHLLQALGYSADSGGNFSARRRHLQALEQAAVSLRLGRSQLQDSGAGELLAEDLRQCQQHLGEITGAVSSDQLLGEIFRSFCIGK